MKTTFHNLSISSVFKGDKLWNAGSGTANYNNHVITVVNTETKARTTFQFWASIMHPEITTEKELLNAFYCFVSDAEAGSKDFEDFCADFGYDSDSRKAYKIYMACKASTKKFDRVCVGLDIHDLINELQELDAA